MTPLPVATSRLRSAVNFAKDLRVLTLVRPPTNCPLLADQFIARRRSFFLEQYDCHSIRNWSL